MASDYKNPPNSGVLFPVRERRTDRSPHYAGTWWMEGGEAYWLSAWRNESAAGKKYITVRLGDRKPDEDQEPDTGPPPADDFDDDIPF